MNLFKDIIPSLLQGKNPVIEAGEDFERYYPPHIVNKALSYHTDCVFFAQEMNKYPHSARKMQHDFYFYGLRKYKRPFPGKWAKKIEDTNDKDIQSIMSALNCGYQKACDILPILSADDLVKLHEEFENGQ